MDDVGVPRAGDRPGVDEVVVVDVVPGHVGVAGWRDSEGHAAVVVGHGPLLVVGEGPCPGRVGEVADALVVGGQVMGPRLVDLVLEVAVCVFGERGLGSERRGAPRGAVPVRYVHPCGGRVARRGVVGGPQRA